MNARQSLQNKAPAAAQPAAKGILHRQCACGNHTNGGECQECSNKKGIGLQAKLRVNEPGDIYEQEADRIADQVLTEPARPEVNSVHPHIQRIAERTTESMETAPVSVERVLVGPGRPLEPALQQDMEQRFDHDFSQVRVHSGPAAEQSALAVNAVAYTVGHHIVFGKNSFESETYSGRRLIAHELAHVVQQSGSKGTPSGLNPPLASGIVQRQLLAPPPQSGGFQRGLRQDQEYLRKPTPEETARRKSAIARENTIRENLKPFIQAISGEFEEDPSTAAILLDTGLGLIPIIDQTLDLRDIVAHIYMLSEKQEYSKPMRWVGLTLTLIGVIPELGSAIKGVAKLLIKKGARAASEFANLLGILKLITKVEGDVASLAQAFRKTLSLNWSKWVQTGKDTFDRTLKIVDNLLESVGDTKRLEQVRNIRNMAAKKLDEAFEKLRREVEDALEALSPQTAMAGGLGGRARIPDAPRKAEPLHTSGAGAPQKADPKRNKYPDFESPRKADSEIVKQQTAKLSNQLGGLNIPEDRVLVAPWVGRVYGTKGKPTSYGTSEGWLRNESRFWSLFKDKFREDYDLLDQGKRVSADFAKKYNWPNTYIGEKLVHHHLENGPLVVAIPESLHKKMHGEIHRTPIILE